MNTQDAAISGARAGLVFGVTELLAFAVVPWIVAPEATYQAFDAGFSLLFIAFYALVAAGIGALSLLLVRRPTPGRIRTFPLLVFVWFLTVWRLFTMPPDRTVLSFLLAVAASVCLAAAGSRGRFGMIANPWTISLLVLLPFALMYSTGVSAWMGGLAAAGIVAVSWFVAASFAGLSGKNRLVVEAGIGLVVLIATAQLSARPLTDVPAAGASAPAGAPNIVLISMDTVRADHLSVYGYHRPTAPAIEEFARGATLYRNSYSAGENTLSSHGSLFTGLYPHVHGAHHGPEQPFGAPLTPGAVTLAEVLRDSGWRTSAVVANAGLLGRQFGLCQGYEHYDDSPARSFLAAPPSFTLRYYLAGILADVVPYSQFSRETRSAAEVNRAVFEELDHHSAESGPLLLFVNYMDAHTPYLPPAPYDRMFPGLDTGFGRGDWVELLQLVMDRKESIPPEQHAHLVSQYDGAVAFEDHHIGELFAALKDRGLYDDSLIIVTSDHGEAFGEHNTIEHSVSVYNEQIRVPLIVKWPGQENGQIVERPVNGVDVMPTILAAAGLPLAKSFAGVDLQRLGEAPHRTLLSESYQVRTVGAGGLPWHREQRAIIDGSLKFIGSSTGERELYQLDSDPGEESNRIDELAREALRLEAQYAEVLAESLRYERAGTELSPQVIDRLRSLGYVK